MQRERRQYARMVLSCPARILDQQRRLLVRGRTVDISAGGVKILGPTVNEPVPGTEVEVEIELVTPNSTKKREVQRGATVRRVEPMGEWTAVSLEFSKVVDL